jgi:hypothetical protein
VRFEIFSLLFSPLSALSLCLADRNQRVRAGTNPRKFHNMELYLSVLSEYMVNCPTRVMSSQVIEVCLETLLRLKVRQSLSPARVTLFVCVLNLNR